MKTLWTTKISNKDLDNELVRLHLDHMKNHFGTDNIEDMVYGKLRAKRYSKLIKACDDLYTEHNVGSIKITPVVDETLNKAGIVMFNQRNKNDKSYLLLQALVWLDYQGEYSTLKFDDVSDKLLVNVHWYDFDEQEDVQNWYVIENVDGDCELSNVLTTYLN